MRRDPLRMYLVLRRGAIAELARAGELAGAAAVACLRVFETEPEHAEAVAAVARAPGQGVPAGADRARSGSRSSPSPTRSPAEADGEAVIALPPRPRSQRGPLLERLQAMSTALEPPPEEAPARDGVVTYALNPAAVMSSGKTVAQIAHAAVMAADTGALEAVGGRGLPRERHRSRGSHVRGARGAGGVRRASRRCGARRRSRPAPSPSSHWLIRNAAPRPA